MKYIDHTFFYTLILISFVFIILEYSLYFNKGLLYQLTFIDGELNIIDNLKHPSKAILQCCYLLAICFYMLSYYILFGKKIFKNKLYFLPRLLIYPLLPSSFIAHMGWSSIHGMEYFFVTKKYFPLRKTSLFKSLGFFLFLITAILFLVDPNWSLFGLLNIKLPESMYKFIFPTLGACQLLHYWIDGRIFKMKDPLIREHIAPILIKDS